MKVNIIIFIFLLYFSIAVNINECTRNKYSNSLNKLKSNKNNSNNMINAKSNSKKLNKKSIITESEESTKEQKKETELYIVIHLLQELSRKFFTIKADKKNKVLEEQKNNNNCSLVMSCSIIKIPIEEEEKKKLTDWYKKLIRGFARYNSQQHNDFKVIIGESIKSTTVMCGNDQIHCTDYIEIKNWTSETNELDKITDLINLYVDKSGQYEIIKGTRVLKSFNRPIITHYLNKRSENSTKNLLARINLMSEPEHKFSA
jgi:hypothetical protein